MKVIILCGIPCSGKSTWASEYKLKNNIISNHIEIVSRDAVRESHFILPYRYTSRNEDLVTNICNDRIDLLINAKSDIIIDNTHCKNVYIDHVIATIKARDKNYDIIIKYFDVSLYRAYFRNIIRYVKEGKWIPIEVLKSMYKNYSNLNREKYKKYEYKA